MRESTSTLPYLTERIVDHVDYTIADVRTTLAAWDAEMSEPDWRPREGPAPRDHPWFGAETDAALLTLVRETARSEAISLDTIDDVNEVLRIMYYG